MKRIHDRSRTAELFIKAGLIAAIAATMLLPTAISANGAEAAPRDRSQLAVASPHTFPLPPIPHLDAIPWLALERGNKGPKIDTLHLPFKPHIEFAVEDRLPHWPDGQRANDNAGNG